MLRGLVSWELKYLKFGSSGVPLRCCQAWKSVTQVQLGTSKMLTFGNLKDTCVYIYIFIIFMKLV